MKSPFVPFHRRTPAPNQDGIFFVVIKLIQQQNLFSKVNVTPVLATINALALTALDGLSDEVHDCHHPIAKELAYEDQKVESLRKTTEFVKVRLHKFLGHFEKVLKGEASGDGPWLYVGTFTYADLVLFQCMDGTQFALPKAMTAAKMSGKYSRVFEHYSAVRARPRIAAYLASERRQKYSIGIYRYYKELDLVFE